jgi:putative transposase
LTLTKEPWPIKESRYTEQRFAFALQQAEGGTPVEEVCRKMGISQGDVFPLEVRSMAG